MLDADVNADVLSIPETAGELTTSEVARNDFEMLTSLVRVITDE